MELFDEVNDSDNQKTDAEKQAILEQVKMPDDWKQALAEEIDLDQYGWPAGFFETTISSGQNHLPQRLANV